jgi:hypothetical protein
MSRSVLHAPEISQINESKNTMITATFILAGIVVVTAWDSWGSN